MGEAGPEVIYRLAEDLLVVRFGEPRPAITIELGDGALARVDPETDELIALEFLNWEERVQARAEASQVGKGGRRPRRPRARRERPYLPRGLVPA
jgi:hypothetical protein